MQREIPLKRRTHEQKIAYLQGYLAALRDIRESVVLREASMDHFYEELNEKGVNNERNDERKGVRKRG